MLLSLSSQLSAELRVLRVWGQLCSVVSVEEKKGAENEVQLVLLSAPELLASRARQDQQPKNMGSFTLVFVSSSMVKRRYHHQITGW